METTFRVRAKRRRMGASLVAMFLWLVPWAGAAFGGIPAEGSKAPAFTLRDLYEEGDGISSAELFRGRVTLISFFATWCEPCKKEIPSLRRMETQFRNRGFRVALICLDIMGTRNVRPYLEEAGGVGLRVLGDKAGAVAHRYGVMHLPTNVLVGPDETVLLSWETHRPEKLDQVEAYLGRLAEVPEGSPAHGAVGPGRQ